MSKSLLLALSLTAVPFAALAMPAVGDIVGTSPEAATAALAKSGCMVDEFEAEGGRIEAKCKNAEGKTVEIYIDPQSGAVVEIKEDEE